MNSLSADSPIKNHASICQFGDVLGDKKISFYIRNKIIYQLLEPKEALFKVEQAFLNFFHFPMKIQLYYKEPDKVKAKKKAESPYKGIYEKALAIYGGRFVN